MGDSLLSLGKSNYIILKLQWLHVSLQRSILYSRRKNSGNWTGYFFKESYLPKNWLDKEENV